MYFIVPTVWSVSKNSVRTELLKAVLDPKKFKRDVISTDWPRDINDGLILLRKIVAERNLSKMTFGASKCPFANQYEKRLGNAIDILASDAGMKIDEILENGENTS